jgi:hypothetical protein
MADNTPVVEVPDLDAETTTAPVKRERAYMAVSARADVIGGGEVFLSKSRKGVAQGTNTRAYVTCEEGISQQSIPYAAIGAALTHDVIPMTQVITRYAKAGRLQELCDLLADHGIIAEPVPGDEPEPDADATPDMEEGE